MDIDQHYEPRHRSFSWAVGAAAASFCRIKEIFLHQLNRGISRRESLSWAQTQVCDESKGITKSAASNDQLEPQARWGQL